MQGLQLALQQTQPIILAAGVVLYLISLVARAAAWSILLDRKATTWQAFIAMNEGYLINNFLPFRLGELARALLLGGETGLGARACPFHHHHRAILRFGHRSRFDHLLAAFCAGLQLGKTGGDRHPDGCVGWIPGSFSACQEPGTRGGVDREKASGNEKIRKHVLPQVDAFFLGLIALRNPFNSSPAWD